MEGDTWRETLGGDGATEENIHGHRCRRHFWIGWGGGGGWLFLSLFLPFFFFPLFLLLFSIPFRSFFRVVCRFVARTAWGADGVAARRVTHL